MVSSDDDSDYTTARTVKKKRRKRTQPTRDVVQPQPAVSSHFSLSALHAVLDEDFDLEGEDFDEFITPSLPVFLRERTETLQKLGQLDIFGNRVRPLQQHERDQLLLEIDNEESRPPHIELLRRKLLASPSSQTPKVSNPHPFSLTLMPKVPIEKPPDPQVIAALQDIKTTPFHNSFLGRLQGSIFQADGIIATDWETRTPWMSVMEDVREHYRILHESEGNDLPEESIAPITYTTLQPNQLPQVHDLLERSFWQGIDVSDSLDYWPERSTIVAVYKKVVVGVSLLSSPRQTYIMYLAVKAGWDKSQIARSMLYHLISLNPGKDITLHVSANNSAMLLYNQFGFKAEEFIAGFYSQYQDPKSKASPNALMLRLRHA